MKKISSIRTFIDKKVLPTIVTVFSAFGIILLFINNGFQLETVMRSIIVLIIQTIGVAFLIFMVEDVMDEVIDCGSYLIVKYKDQEEHIPLTNIAYVSSWISYRDAPRIRLHLKKRCQFGDVISFLPVTPFFFNRFKKVHPIEEELNLRINPVKPIRKKPYLIDSRVE